MDIIPRKARTMFRMAAEEASLSDHPQFHLGAVVCKGAKVISLGHNSDTHTDPIQAALDTKKYGCPCCGKLHAESSALIPLIKRHVDTNGAEIYVYRSLRSGSHGMARPCSTCMQLIRQCGIKKIHYSTSDGFADETIDYSKEQK